MWTADAGPVVGAVLSGLWIVVAAVLLPGRVGIKGGTTLPVLAASWAAVTLLAAHFAVVDAVEDASTVALLDAPLHAWFVGHRTGLLDPLMVAVSDLGGVAGMGVLTAVGATLLVRYRRRAHAVIVVAAFVGAQVLGEGAKLLYRRARPPVADQLVMATSYALPSGHSLGAIVVVGVLAAVVLQLAPGAPRRVAVIVLAAVVVLVIGMSRLYLGVHWPTDVLAGYVLGGAWLAVCIGALTVLERRRVDVATLVAAPTSATDGSFRVAS